jgi:hypothetical protein
MQDERLRRKWIKENEDKIILDDEVTKRYLMSQMIFFSQSIFKKIYRNQIIILIT